jgi:hypothetical protein
MPGAGGQPLTRAGKTYERAARNGSRHGTIYFADSSPAGRLDDIAAIATRAGLGEEALKNRVSYTEIVKAVDATGAPGSLVELSWKICSGLTHGDSWAAWSASRMTQIPSPVQDGVATLKMEANLSLLMQMTTLAVRLTGRGWQLHDQRCQSPYLSSATAQATRCVSSGSIYHGGRRAGYGCGPARVVLAARRARINAGVRRRGLCRGL